MRRLRRRSALEEGLVELLGALGQARGREDEGHVDVGRAVRDHLQWSAHGFEDLERLPQDLARVALRSDKGEHCHVLHDLHLGHRLQFRPEAEDVHRLEAPVQGQRHRDLRRGDDVDGGLKLVEDLKDVREEAVLAQHARAPDDDHGDAGLAAHGRDGTLPAFASHQFGDDAGAWLVGEHGVAHAHRHLAQPRRHDCGWVHHLGPKHRKLRSLLIGQDPDGLRRGNEARVRGQDAADILPDLHLRGMQRCPDHRGSQVRAVAAEGRNHAFGVLGNVPCDDRQVGVVHLQRSQV
mmetsp:Transcript_42944/g.115761  ORF Transcript_42944/g.115761 Transcript_42944/m.115761 type:complete len:293 (-) Transcript_42944:72-950(-)